MSSPEMTSLRRVLITFEHREPDRVPFFLLLTLHGAKELGLSIEEYFSRAEHVVEGQMRLREKYRDDCIVSFFHAPLEMEAWGGEVIYREDGPPNSGAPIIKQFDDINSLEAPRMKDARCFDKVLQATRELKSRIKDKAPIIGVVMSPFSLPIMQLGFENYLILMLEHPGLFQRLINLNMEFCVEWANAQLEAGATALCYFDPVSSPTIVPRDFFLSTGFTIAQKTMARIKGPLAIHLASGRSLSIIDDIAQTGATAIGVSTDEDLAILKEASKGKITLLGNLNGIEMRRWSPEQTEAIVKDAILKAGKGGGFILSDNHGEIPWQVPDEVLLSISETVHHFGCYPLE